MALFWKPFDHLGEGEVCCCFDGALVLKMLYTFICLSAALHSL